MNEQLLKRLQDMLKLQSAIIEQLETLAWLTKDIVEDLVLELDPSMKVSSNSSMEGSGKPSETSAAAPAAAEQAKDGCPG